MHSFSGEKYRQVESLFLWRDDLAFLQSQPGYHASIGRAFSESRRNLARRWLTQIRGEFDQLYTEGQLILVNSPVDRPDLVRELLRLRLRFYRNMMVLRVRLVLGCSLSHEIRALTTAFESLIGYSLIVKEDVGGLYLIGPTAT